MQYSRTPGSFIFNLTNNEKYDLNDPFYNSAIYRYSSYGPTFGNGHDIYLADGCKLILIVIALKVHITLEILIILGENGQTDF